MTRLTEYGLGLNLTQQSLWDSWCRGTPALFGELLDDDAVRSDPLYLNSFEVDTLTGVA